MSKELTKKAADMLLNGATLLGDACPYCKGVRVMKEGHALCINCGREPGKKEIPQESNIESKSTLKEVLEEKIKSLSIELEQEKDHEKQQIILKSINSILETIERIDG
jgi:UPF0148 protein